MEYCKITNEELYIILLSKLNDPYLSKYIIQIKIEEEKKEKKEALEYHIERWETISSKYFNSQELSPLSCLRNIYSYVLDSKDFIFEKDRIIDYYIETGISFQNRELLLQVISTKTREFEYDENISNIHPDVKEARNNDDFLYGILSKKIYSQMKVIKRHHNELPLYL